MNDNTKQTRHNVEWATAAGKSISGDMDPDSVSLRIAFLKFGCLIEQDIGVAGADADAESIKRMAESTRPHLPAARIPSRLRRNLGAWPVLTAAASVFVAVGIGLSMYLLHIHRPSNHLQIIAAPTARVHSPPHAVAEDSLPWKDSVEDEIDAVHHAATDAQSPFHEDIYAEAGSFVDVQAGLDKLNREMNNL